MAKLVDKIMHALKLGDPIDDEIDINVEEPVEESAAQNIRPARREPKPELERYERPVRNVTESVSSFSRSEKSTSSAPKSNVVSIQASVKTEVVVIQPLTYDEAQVIADHIRSYRPVIVNLEKLDYTIAQRIMDFVSGAVYTLGGNLERVTQNIFIIAPENVDIAGHFQEELKSNGIILPWKSE